MKAILTYHSIDDSGSPISVPAEAFAAHVRWFTSGRIRVLSPADLLNHADDSADAVAVTFDDGFSNARPALDQLIDLGLPATVFVVTDHVGRTNAWGGRAQPGIPTLPLLDWTSLEDLVGRGASVEAHTRTHRPLTGLSTDEVDAELLGSREELRARLGVVSRHVAYPYGAVNDVVAVRAARSFQFGHATDFSMLHGREPLMRLPRLDMYYFTRPGALEAWRSAAFTRRLASIRIRRRIRAWARI